MLVPGFEKRILWQSCQASIFIKIVTHNWRILITIWNFQHDQNAPVFPCTDMKLVIRIVRNSNGNTFIDSDWCVNLVYNSLLAVKSCFPCICFDGVVITGQCTATFQDLLCSPNLDITRTWMCRLNFTQRPIFSGFKFFNEPEISDSRPQLKVPPGELVLRIFTSWKIHRPQSGLNPRTLDLEASTLPRDHRDRLMDVGCRRHNDWVIWLLNV